MSQKVQTSERKFLRGRAGTLAHQYSLVKTEITKYKNKSKHQFIPLSTFYKSIIFF